MRSYHSPFVPVYAPPLTRREKALLTVALLISLGIVVVFAWGLLQLALRLAVALGWEGW